MQDLQKKSSTESKKKKIKKKAIKLEQLLSKMFLKNVWIGLKSNSYFIFVFSHLKKKQKKSDQIRATTFKNVFEKCMDRIEEQFLLHICIFAFKKKGYITLTQGEKNLQNLRPYGLCRTCIIRVRKQNYVTLKKEREIYIELLTFKIGF
eukprot:TRINITY_DN21315_c0_g1_i3.p3 TRINITY_DN21315_c0_g1~~TRINITY_DN21315_c0_g1_i3.p3  ORF type:complete len:149 (-),score=13.43 TRINITY_DN21315_c0_g1_i3:94-540(-)